MYDVQERIKLLATVKGYTVTTKYDITQQKWLATMGNDVCKGDTLEQAVEDLIATCIKTAENAKASAIKTIENSERIINMRLVASNTAEINI